MHVGTRVHNRCCILLSEVRSITQIECKVATFVRRKFISHRISFCQRNLH